MRPFLNTRHLAAAKERLRSLLLDDHCEWANQYVYWLRSPLGVLGLSAVASLLLGLFVAPQGYVLLAAILAVIVTGLVWPKIGIRGLACELTFTAPRAREGKPTPIEVQITNRWPFPVWGLAIEQGFFDAGPGEDRAAVALARINGWSRTTFCWDFTPEQRGRYPKQTPVLATAFPFGLWKACKPVSITGSIVAWPKTFWLPAYPLSAESQIWSGDPSDAHAGSEGERIGVRDHRHGDSLRLVHWAKTARHDRLIVSEREGASFSSALLRVDTDPQSHTGSGVDSSLEWSIRIAASVADALLTQGVRLDLQLGNETHSFGAARIDNVKLMDWLAEYDHTAAEAASLSGKARRGRHSTTRLQIGTTRSKATTGAAMILLDTGAFADRSRRIDFDAPAANDPRSNDSGVGCIVVDAPHAVADQVLRGWRLTSQRACREA